MAVLTDGQKAARSAAIRHAKDEASSPKSRLIRLARDLRDARAFREAKSLDSVIAKLEVWQNT